MLPRQPRVVSLYDCGICIGAQVVFLCGVEVSMFVLQVEYVHLQCICQSVRRGSGCLIQCVTLCVLCSQG